MSIKRILIIVIILGIAVYAAVSIVQNNRYQKLLSDAVSLYDEGKYEEAAGIFEQLKEQDSKDWIVKCERAIADRDAKAMLEAGNPEAALALLSKKNPESELMTETVDARAEELVKNGHYASAMTLLKEKNPESGLMGEVVEAYAAETAEQGDPEKALNIIEVNCSGRVGKNIISYCENYTELKEKYGKMSREQAFWSSLNSGDVDAASSKLRDMKNAKMYGSSEFSDDELSAMQTALYDGMARQRAQDYLSRKSYNSAFDEFEKLDDQEGMLAVTDAAEEAGESDAAFYLAVRMGDLSRAESLYERLTEASPLQLTSGGGSYCEWALTELVKQDSAEANRLAEKFMDQVVQEAQTMITEGKRSDPWQLLAVLKSHAEPLWTEEMETMKNSLTEEFPENGIFRDKGLAEAAKSSQAKATIHVHNRSKDGMIFYLLQDMSNSIYIFVRPHSDYTFTVPAGKYSPGMYHGDVWFGEKELFGSWTELMFVDIDVDNGMKTVKQGDRLEGSYSFTYE